MGDGLAALLTTWTSYALIVTALAGFALQQSALKTGHLAPALASSNASTLLISVLLGIRIFEETLADAGGNRAIAFVALAAAAVGLALLSTPTPSANPNATAPVDEHT
jgi:hypothetical protein